jgi:cytochrome P450
VPSIDRLKETHELDAVVREAMRLYPAAFAVYREALETFEFGGHTIEEGSDVLVFTTATHADPRYFEKPAVFDIDRYAAPRNEHRQGHCFAPYGGGPHICLGAGMGEAQLLLTTAMIVREFDIQVVSPRRELKPHYDPSLTPPRNLVLAVTRRCR